MLFVSHVTFFLYLKHVDVEYPERRRLKIQEKVPQFASHIRPPKMFKQIILMRGPEQVHNKLFLKKYGIQVSV